MATFHYTDAQLQKIITGTDNVIQSLHQLRQGVNLQTENLRVANKSTSGNLMGGHLDNWTSDFNTTVAHLHELNQKAHGLLMTNRGTSDTTTSQAQ